MPADLEKYRPYVDGLDLTEDQKTELIHTLWTIMEAFADQAFGLHPAQQMPACPWPGDSPPRPERVDLPRSAFKDPFKQAAGPSRRRKGKAHEGD